MKGPALLGTFALCLVACWVEPQRVTNDLGPVETVPLRHVRLLDGPFNDAQDRNLDYVMAMDPDRLLAPYLEEAGLEPRAANYGNWESSGLNGHIGGHYLTALSLAWAATGRQDVLDRLDYMLDELQRAQDANGDGYLGGVPGSDTLWRQIAAGDIRAEPFALNGAWVPWYNLHKIFAGLRDAWLYADRQQARQMQGQDRLDGLHANTQIPKVIGYERIAEVGDESEWRRAAAFFWDTVVNHRTVAFGGNSVREHFHSPDDFGPMIRDVEGPETCNTYNMLRLTRLLYQATPEQKYVDYYERALYNHILSSQDPATGGLVYFTPVRPQHYRVYSQVHESMWCCVGSGIENHFKYGELVYARDNDDLFVNLYIPSRIDWPEKGLLLRQENDFPDRAATRLVFESDTDTGLELRYPSWAASEEATVLINGEPQDVSAEPGSYIRLQRHWKKGDVVSLELPMATHVERLPDGSEYFAILYGPIVLAARTTPLKDTPFEDEVLDFYADDSRMGHVPSGATYPLASSPVLVSSSPADIVEHIRRVQDGELRFRFSGMIEPDTYSESELIPFFRVHRSRYVLYWPHRTAAEQ